MSAQALVVDMSYTATGWVVARLGAGTPEPIIGQGFITTEPLKNARSKVESDVLRCVSIMDELGCMASRYDVSLLIVEQPLGREGYYYGKTVGVCCGVVAALRHFADLAWLPITPYEGKRAVTGRKNASKEAVQEIVVGWWPEAATWEGYEHCCDALAALVAARTSDLYRMAAQAGKAP